ncbi:cyclin-like protein [Hesseltinella vesiculosa]|uniref:Cyclin-like protein n=1 Tax=Hesseltinella vesiculosa TaxID=101127 RepID=A0A1X2GJ36_9FUNG|nr:cyclin-like protein [Hesseltinella vesiculosa]
MLLAPTTLCLDQIPPGFIDKTSSCFDAILYPNLPKSYDITSPCTNAQRRPSHLPDLIPFIQLITEKCKVKPVHLIMALIYVQRFRSSLPSGYQAEPEAAHRIFVASLLVASKFSEDHCLSTKQVVLATGDVWSIKEITRMELALLRFLQWNLNIQPDEMLHFLDTLGIDSHTIFAN